MSNQRHQNTNNVGHHAADNIGSQPGNNVLDIILGKKEAFLGSNLKGGELSRSRKTRSHHMNLEKGNQDVEHG